MVLNRSDNILSHSRALTRHLEGSWFVWYAVAVGVMLTMSLLTFIYGLISWKIIRKFRNIKNYTYLNAVLVNIFRSLLTLVYMILLYVNTDFSQNVVFLLIHFSMFIYLSMAYNHWLLVMNYIFYVDVVKVFQLDIKKKYLKSWLFGWVLPLVIFFVLTLLFTIERPEGGVWFLVACNLLPFSVNMIIYVKVLWNLFLFKDTSASVVTKKGRWLENCRRLTIVTTIFALSSAVMLTAMIWEFFNFVTLLRAVSLGLQIAVLAIYVPFVKCNRELWREYFALRSRRTI